MKKILVSVLLCLFSFSVFAIADKEMISGGIGYNWEKDSTAVISVTMKGVSFNFTGESVHGEHWGMFCDGSIWFPSLITSGIISIPRSVYSTLFGVSLLIGPAYYAKLNENIASLTGLGLHALFLAANGQGGSFSGTELGVGIFQEFQYHPSSNGLFFALKGSLSRDFYCFTSDGNNETKTWVPTIGLTVGYCWDKSL